MHSAIEVRHESKRGCGYRKVGGIYLCCDVPSKPCGKLPIELTVCPVCHAGIKPSRGWTWINAKTLIDDAVGYEGSCQKMDDHELCADCLLAFPPDRAGLIWIGEKFYPTPQAWQKEAQNMGVSRRIPAVPKDFTVGETLVLAAHRKVLRSYVEGQDEPDDYPAIFAAFIPTRVERVVSGDESNEEIEKLLKRGFTLVKVEKNSEQMQLEKAV